MTNDHEIGLQVESTRQCLIHFDLKKNRLYTVVFMLNIHIKKNYGHENSITKYAIGFGYELMQAIMYLVTKLILKSVQFQIT